MRIKMIIILLTVGLFIGCAAKIPREVTSRVTYKGDFKTLQASPQRFKGEFAILGGAVISVENREKGSVMTVLQYPLDSDFRPQTEKNTGGRFRVVSDQFLDPAVYQPGTLVTAAGEIEGGETRPIGDYRYVYPVINGRIWTWKPESGGFPRISFGLGVGTVF